MRTSVPLPAGPGWSTLVAVAAVAGLAAGAAGGAVTAVLFGENSERGSAPLVCPTSDGSGAIREVVAQVTPSVVSIHVIFETAQNPMSPVPLTGAASGFVFDTRGHIVTNEHVVAGARTITVTHLDGTSARAELIGIDEANDIAVLRIEAAGLPPLELGASSRLDVGDSVLAISNWRAPEGGPTASLGIVSATGRDILTPQGRGYGDLIQTDAAMESGDSGGPLVDMDGRVVGVMVAGSISGQCVGFAIPIERAAESVNEILVAYWE